MVFYSRFVYVSDCVLLPLGQGGQTYLMGGPHSNCKWKSPINSHAISHTYQSIVLSMSALPSLFCPSLSKVYLPWQQQEKTEVGIVKVGFHTGTCHHFRRVVF